MGLREMNGMKSSRRELGIRFALEDVEKGKSFPRTAVYTRQHTLPRVQSKRGQIPTRILHPLVLMCARIYDPSQLVGWLSALP